MDEQTVQFPSSVESYLNTQAHKGQKLCHPAAERNKEPILQTLKSYVNPSSEGILLEISSGSGQHVAHIAPNFPNISFQPTEIDESSLRSIAAYAGECPTGNIRQPVPLDVRNPVSYWLDGSLEKESVDYILNINMMHISAWECAEGLFKGSGELLKPGGYLFTYGPYASDGIITPNSNVQFDQSLKIRDHSWGLRDINKQLIPLALKNDIILKHKHDLPANNKLLVWQKQL